MTAPKRENMSAIQMAIALLTSARMRSKLILIWISSKIYLMDVGYTSTVAAFTMFGATQESMRMMKVAFCTIGMSISTQINAHKPGPRSDTTVNSKGIQWILHSSETDTNMSRNSRKIGNFPTLLTMRPMSPRHMANEISKMKLSPNVSDSSSVMQIYGCNEFLYH